MRTFAALSAAIVVVAPFASAFAPASTRWVSPSLRTSTGRTHGNGGVMMATKAKSRDEEFEIAGERITRESRRGNILDGLVEVEGELSPGAQGSMADDPLLPTIHCIAKAADKRKAAGILAMRVSHVTFTTEFFVNMMGNSRPQNQAIAASIEEDMEEMFGRKCQVEGTADSGWILLDYGDVIVNVMTPRSRDYYDLESFWSEGELVNLEGVLTPDGPPPMAMGAAAAAAGAAMDDEEDDPFWADDDGLGASGGDLSDGAAAGAQEESFAMEMEEEGEGAAGGDASDSDNAVDEEDPFWS